MASFGILLFRKNVVQHVITFNLFPGAMLLFQHHFVKRGYTFFSKPARGFIPEHIEMPDSIVN